MKSELAHHVRDTMDTAPLSPALVRWLDRLADTVDDYELFADARRLGEILPAIVEGVAGKAHTVEAHRSQRDKVAPIAA